MGDIVKLRIFVFDREDSLRELLTIIARNKGHEVFSFAEPAICPLYSDPECSCPLEYTCGDLIIIDNRMLKMPAMELIRKQIEHGCKGSAQNKLVLSTSSTNKEELRLAEELGFKLMKKPFKVKDISDWIDECEKRIDPNRKLAELDLESL